MLIKAWIICMYAYTLCYWPSAAAYWSVTTQDWSDPVKFITWGAAALWGLISLIIVIKWLVGIRRGLNE